MLASAGTLQTLDEIKEQWGLDYRSQGRDFVDPRGPL